MFNLGTKLHDTLKKVAEINKSEGFEVESTKVEKDYRYFSSDSNKFPPPRNNCRIERNPLNTTSSTFGSWCSTANRVPPAVTTSSYSAFSGERNTKSRSSHVNLARTKSKNRVDDYDSDKSSSSVRSHMSSKSERDRYWSRDLPDENSTRSIKYVLSRKNNCELSSISNEDDCDKKFVGYKYLIGLNDKRPHEIVCEITRTNGPFEAFLNDGELEADWLFLVIKIIKQLCLSDFEENKRKMLSYITRSRVLRCISYYLGEIELETNEKTIANLKFFIEDLTILFSTLINVMPMVAFEIDLKKIIMKTVLATETLNTKFKCGVEENVVSKLYILGDRLDDYKGMLEKKSTKNHNSSYEDKLSNIVPPDDFRELSLYPTVTDLTRDDFGFLRPSKAKGAYIDAEHYLDVQFRLLREDFIHPLRRGLRMYTETKSFSGQKRLKSKLESLRLYHRTKFEQFQVMKHNQVVGIVVNFDPNKRMRINWEYSKRLMFGSLLLFTINDFESFFYGTVLGRDINNLSKGKILVHFSSEVQITKDHFKREFLMAESEIFFEPYHLVMKALKTFNKLNFPMPRYIINGERESKVPAYIGYMKNLAISDYMIQPTKLESWPAAVDLELDNSQYEAFRTALTSDFSVIQGPPGTGKTFIGLKIVEVLLNNLARYYLFSREAKSPILVVCYTNHALDQFLEGILKVTTNIVRVGSQSKSELLSQYNIRSSHYTNRRQVAWNIHHAMAAVKKEVVDTLIRIDYLIKLKDKIESPVGLLSYKLLSSVMSGNQKTYIRSDEDLVQWLLPIWDRGDSDDESDDERLINFASQISINHENTSYSVIDASNYIDNFDDLNLVETSMIDKYAVEKSTIDKYGDIHHESFYSRLLENVVLEYNSLASMYEKIKLEIKESKTVRDVGRLLNKKYELNRLLKVKLTGLKIFQKKLNQQWALQPVEPILKANFATLNVDQRWILYWHWVAELRDDIFRQTNEAHEEFSSKVQRYEEFKQMEDYYVVKDVDIVGMTTTCAARLHLLLQQLKPRIVIIEEAAEVLEAHIVTSLTNACEHLILIGDHKQLKPSVAVYQLCKKYNFDVSLFERMINNGMHCPILNIQHRMRPEISQLITPLIYPDLKNDESVMTYEPIKGVAKNIFFFEHHEYEEEVDDTNSRKNIFESDFIIELCRYLVLQGYNPENITILTTYAGQMFLVREKKQRNPIICAVKCIVVDKYQGEENDIILLSLVRSNEEANIGFLKTENRVCVALSRARKGLYIVGNMDNLCKSSPLWTEIRKILEKQNAIGKGIPLHCSKHGIYTTVACLNDFDAVREGGCNVLCGELLKCGHNCKSLCHTMDSEHLEIKCREPCDKKCERLLHVCKLQCYLPCNLCTIKEERVLPCGHTKYLKCFMDENTYECDEIFEDVLPLCLHKTFRKCSQKLEDVACQTDCDARLDCGHVCPQKCHKKQDPDHLDFKCLRSCDRLNDQCSREHKCMKMCFENCGLCNIEVLFKLPCSHEMNLPCCTDMTEFKCPRKCEKYCPDCNKKCKRKCQDDCVPCMNKVEKTIEECGHKLKIACHEKPIRAMCKEPCKSIAPCGHKCKAACNQLCNSNNCPELVKVEGVPGLCGHNFVKVPCHDRVKAQIMDKKDLLQYCDEPCGTILKCGDACLGTCGQCWQGRLHKSCQEKCYKILICGHSCEYPCQEVCPPCIKPCMNRCKHSICRKNCGVPCNPCQELCEWSCKHSKCSRKCGEMCNRKPCYKPCEKTLKCGHPCIGFCGDPCPNQCKICNPEILEIFFGSEEDDNARFVLLEDCGHAVESKGLEQYLGTDHKAGEIVMQTCPMCKTPITRTLRYMNYVKKTYDHIVNVKKKIFGHGKWLYKKRDDLFYSYRQLREATNDIVNVIPGLNGLRHMVENYLDLLRIRNNRQINMISSAQLSAINFYYEIFHLIITGLDKVIVKTKVEEKYTDREYRQRGGFRLGRVYEVQRVRTVTKKTLNSLNTVSRTLDFICDLLSRAKRINLEINQQQSEDLSLEVSRFSKMIDLCVLMRTPEYNSSSTFDDVIEIRLKMENHLFGFSRFSSEILENVNKLFEDMQKALKSVRSLTSEEKRMIHLAMSKDFFGGSQKAGHWFTCSSGHYYCITECGGAMEESTCPDCGEKIGGRQHRYVDTMRLASDMDGATRPAWDSGQDIANFIL